MDIRVKKLRIPTIQFKDYMKLKNEDQYEDMSIVLRMENKIIRGGREIVRRKHRAGSEGVAQGPPFRESSVGSYQLRKS